MSTKVWEDTKNTIYNGYLWKIWEDFCDFWFDLRILKQVSIINKKIQKHTNTLLEKQKNFWPQNFTKSLICLSF